MSLPATFADADTYFAAAVEFLRSHAWMYHHANTCFIKAGVLDNFPPAYKDYFLHVHNDGLNQFPFVYHHAMLDLPDALINFRTTLSTLTPEVAYNDAESIEFADHASNLRKMSAKKQHEVLRFAQLINELCHAGELIVDFGAGLGYLSELLYKHNTDRLILGLESDLYRVEAATARQVDYMPSATNSIVYKQTFITGDSDTFILEHAQALARVHHIAEPQLVIVGLHACADLTITSMQLFLRMAHVRKLIIMPCCYHKLQTTAANTFNNFPLSDSLKRVVGGDDDSGAYFNIPFLRLACQQTAARWGCCSAQQHEAHGRQMFDRALAEAVRQEAEVVVKLKRNEINCSEHQMEGFAGLCAQYTLRSKVTDTPLSWSPQHEVKFNEISARHGEGHKLAEGLTCLQTTMQKLCENIVLYDRLCYMEEQARKQSLKVNVRFQKVLNEKLSPRCYVLIAEKL